jgi:hypothetical protein
MFEHSTATEQSLAQGNEEVSFSIKLRDMAKQARIEADGNETRAFDLFKQRVEREDAYRDFMLDEACRSYLRDAVISTRGVIERQAWAAPSQGGDRIAATLRNRETVYDWPLPISGGKTLGRATLAEIKESRIYHEGQASGHVSRAKFYAAIERRMKRAGANIVKEALNEEQIEKLLQESTND